MIRRPPRSTRTDTLFPYTPLFRSPSGSLHSRPAAVRRLFGGRTDLHGQAAVRLFVDGLRDDRHHDPEIGRAHVELQSLMRISYAVFCLKKKNITHSIKIHIYT